MSGFKDVKIKKIPPLPWRTRKREKAEGKLKKINEMKKKQEKINKTEKKQEKTKGAKTNEIKEAKRQEKIKEMEKIDGMIKKQEKIIDNLRYEEQNPLITLLDPHLNSLTGVIKICLEYLLIDYCHYHCDFFPRSVGCLRCSDDVEDLKSFYYEIYGPFSTCSLYDSMGVIHFGSEEDRTVLTYIMETLRFDYFRICKSGSEANFVVDLPRLSHLPEKSSSRGRIRFSRQPSTDYNEEVYDPTLLLGDAK